MDYGEVQALELHAAIQVHGWPMVESLRTLRMTRAEAEALYVRLGWLATELPRMRDAFQAG